MKLNTEPHSRSDVEYRFLNTIFYVKFDNRMLMFNPSKLEIMPGRMHVMSPKNK